MNPRKRDLLWPAITYPVVLAGFLFWIALNYVGRRPFFWLVGKPVSGRAGSSS